MRKSQEKFQQSLDSFNALYGNISKTDLKLMAASAIRLQWIDNISTTDVLREVQLFLSCQFILLNPGSIAQKEKAMQLIQVLHGVCTELEWQQKFTLSLID